VRVTGLRLRGILDSRAQATVEAELRLDGIAGRGSCAVAIKPGRLERPRQVHAGALGDLTGSPVGRVLHDALTGSQPAGQHELDALLRDLDDRHNLGADITLAVSLAHARASASAVGLPLHRWIAGLAGTRPAMPRLLVNVFSGGIHHQPRADSFQQVMIVPPAGDLPAGIQVALAVYADCERQAGRPAISASSGLLTPGRDTAWQLDTLTATAVSIGIDVAAEHLAAGERGYRFEGREYLAPGFADLLLGLAGSYRVEYLEDPFDPADIPAWEAFLPAARAAGVTVVGDDLFVTDHDRVRGGLADALLLKLSQAGTLTATLQAARAARAAGLKLAVSHRSGETEDCAMCDLAVAVGAEFIKVGGPRRGDRLAKYNQLLRLAEAVGRQEEERLCPAPASSSE
jgi:enolase